MRFSFKTENMKKTPKKTEAPRGTPEIVVQNKIENRGAVQHRKYHTTDTTPGHVVASDRHAVEDSVSKK
jgi:hypothetical protein